MKRLLLALAILCGAAPLWAAAGRRANACCRRPIGPTAKRGTRRPMTATRSLLGNAGADGHLLYNLGNAAFRLNQIGRAILCYERARVLLPRDADLAFNLGHARERVRDVIPETEGFVGTAFFWLGSLTLAEIFWCFAAANALFWGIAAARLFSRAEWTSCAALHPAGGLAAGGALASG